MVPPKTRSSIKKNDASVKSPRETNRPKEPPRAESSLSPTLGPGTKRKEATKDNADPESQPKKIKSTFPFNPARRTLHNIPFVSEDSSVAGASQIVSSAVPADIAPLVTTPAAIKPAFVKPTVAIEQILINHLLQMDQARERRNTLVYNFINNAATGATDPIRRLLAAYHEGMTGSDYLYGRREERAAVDKLKKHLATYKPPKF